MKRFLFLLISCITISCTAQSVKYGAGVTHVNAPPQYSKNYNVNINPSLVDYDSTEQALWGSDKRFGAFKLASPDMRYVRGYINKYFINNEVVPLSFIENEIRIQAGSNEVLNGLYLVRFTTEGGNLTDILTLDCNAVTGVLIANEYTIKNGYIAILRYYRNQLKTFQLIIDKQAFFYQSITDSLNDHRRIIDSLSQYPDINFWRLGGNSNAQTEKFGTTTNQDVSIITNNAQRGIITKGGFFGHGVTDPTAYSDNLNTRNRGAYYDRFNLSGEAGQSLKSFGVSGTAWQTDFKALKILHTNANELVQVGKSKDFVSVTYFEKLHSVTVSTINSSTQGNISLRLFAYDGLGNEVTLSNFDINNLSNTRTVLINQAVNYYNYRIEVVTTQPNVYGLSCTLNFIDTQ